MVTNNTTMVLFIVLFACIFRSIHIISGQDEIYYGTFPDDFIWSAATAAYQVEGAWNTDGRGPSIWDTFSHNLSNIENGNNGDVACDSYHNYQQDVKLLKDLGVSHYRFSISWSRLFPLGTTEMLNPRGVDYYHRLIDALSSANIKPMVTLYHWDLPQALENEGGWLNETIVEHFEKYADFCFKTYGNKVKHWITLNEPWIIAWKGYGSGEFAPGKSDDPGRAPYTAAHNLIKAHGKAYRKYNNIYRKTQNGIIGITLNIHWAEPKDPQNPAHVKASETMMQFDLGWFTNPILVNGEYPEVMINNIRSKSDEQGLPDSRLPSFNEKEKREITESADFIGINFYTSSLVYPVEFPVSEVSYLADKDVDFQLDPKWLGSGSSWLKVTPFGMRKTLNWIKSHYNNVSVIITENGVSDRNGSLVDVHRINYYRSYINEVLKAIRLDYCNVIGYTAWSLLDNFEWTKGYSEKFGLYHVDFNDPHRKRTPKASAQFYKQVIEENQYKPGYSGKGGRGIAPAHENGIYFDTFPKDFAWSTATAAYQIEGAWNEDGKGPSIWDDSAHQDGYIHNNENGDVACDSYHKYKEDVALLKELGVSHYRFSISWPRVFPNGTKESRNDEGVQYYHRLIDELLSVGITPMVTLYHWDLPLALEKNEGGWLNESIVQRFKDYAEFCFSEYGKKVKLWITFNEPWIVSWLGYGVASFPPGKKGPGTNPYLVSHNLIKAHAEAFHAYEKYKGKQGKIGITLNVGWAEPEDPYNPEHLEASERDIQFNFGWFAHPIVINGNYPQVMIDRIRERSPDLNSRLPTFSKEEQKRINGTADFIGINFYTSSLVRPNEAKPGADPSYDVDKGTAARADSSWLGSGSGWLKVTPFGLRKMLNWIRTHYDNFPVYITENGISDNNGSLIDYHRIHYYRTYINEMLKAIKLDGCNVKGYTAWSLMDNVEWRSGFSERFGLHYVNFTDPNRPRTPKASARFYKQIISENGFKRGYTSLGGRGTAPLFEHEFYYDSFPEDFTWSTATAAYQVEGGWNEDGRGPSVWDTWAHAGRIRDNTTGDIACDSYHKYKEDVQLLHNLGVDHYRFSISWPRILPEGTIRTVNRKGIAYYNNLINELVKYDIKPMVTLFHWDLPQALEDYGGWLNETTEIHFRNYAELCFKEFGDRVKLWISFNEPWITAWISYGTGGMAPGQKGPGTFTYQAAHNIIKAHALAYHVYNNTYRSSQKGMFGMTVSIGWSEPEDPFNPEHLKASERDIQFNGGWFLNPILKNGNYPEEMLSQVGNKSKLQGLNKTRLTPFTLEEQDLIKGTGDFLGLNHYSSSLVYPEQRNINDISFEADKDIGSKADPNWLGSGSSWLYVTPWGMRKILNWVKKTYNNVPVYVTENGVSDRNGSLVDYNRIYFYRSYINELLKAIKLDGCNVKGYTAWSLMDNLEWNEGFAEKFGLHFVNFSDPNRPRTPKLSTVFYNQLIQDNAFLQDSPTSPDKEKELGVYRELPFSNKFYFGIFPDNFMWGVSTSAFQIEGGLNEDGIEESEDDYIVGEGVKRDILPGSTSAHVACDSYHKFHDDVRILKETNVTHYRFSISWTRILPDGTTRTINDIGVQYYQNLIDSLVDSGIVPMVTIHHFDIPLKLAQSGGWLNESIIEHFEAYSKILFKEYGDRVKYWVTLNEPFTVASLTKDPYVATHNMIKAHARVYHLYNKEFRKTQKGIVGISLNTEWNEPKTATDPADVHATRRQMEHTLGWIAHPIFVNGDYSESLKKMLNAKSKQGNLTRNKLPAFSAYEMKIISGSADFLGLNFFSTSFVQDKFQINTGFGFDTDTEKSTSSHWRGTDVSPMKFPPFGLRKVLNWIKDQYNNVPVYITENGYPDGTGTLHDLNRINFLNNTINEVLKAIRIDECDVRAYTVWSLMDNVNSKLGIDTKFGLYNVDFNDRTRPRKRKLSAKFYSHVIKNHGFLEDDMEFIPLLSGTKENDPYRTLPYENRFYYGTFPEGFAWSTATASYQIEGGWNEDGKGEGIWDVFAHAGHVDNNDTGDVACDSYHKYREDVQLLSNIKVTHYRFSISWPRILPDGTKKHVNLLGIQYYSNLIDELLDADIIPMVTLYHWDLPQALMENGGWLNESTTEHFADYAEICFNEFGDRVKFWITLNEPFVVSNHGYEIGVMAPGITGRGDKIYVVGHNLIKAHAKAYRIYEKQFKQKQKGQVGITLNTDWQVPKNPNDHKDQAAADRAINFMFGWFLNPVIRGDYPDVMKEQVSRKSSEQGYNRSRLPEFTQTEKHFIGGSYDFLGMNFYTSNIIANYKSSDQSYTGDQDAEFSKDPLWIGSGSSWLKVTPVGIRRMLNWVKFTYGDVPIYITENGVSDRNGSLQDNHRIYYYKHYINNVLKAIKLDGIDVRGYTAWSLMDNFEWSRGYSERFGLHYVDFNDPQRHRTPKASARYFTKLIQDNGFIDDSLVTASKQYLQNDPNRALPQEHDFYYDTFPDSFAWSTATASYQIEGGWNEDGKGVGIWDVFSHAGRVDNNNTGDIACDSYHKYLEDVRLLRNMKVTHYRFSISWPRILPDGTMKKVNRMGIQYYNDLINALINSNIVPMVTLHHWDLPQALMTNGGWQSVQTAQHFGDFAALCFNEFGDRVKYWITLNEPWVIANQGYESGTKAPGITGKGDKVYVAAHNLLKAHAKVYRIYQTQFKESQKGYVGITLNTDWQTPKNPNDHMDRAAAERAIEFMFGWFLNPVIKGDYPDVMKQQIAIKSAKQNHTNSRLPEFTRNEQKLMKGSFDFLGMNFYTSNVIAHKESSEQSYTGDQDTEVTKDPSWLGSGSSWLKVTPVGIRRMLNWVKYTYGDVPIYITENGISDRNGSLQDDHRIFYYKHYINNVLKAIKLDGVDVRGYTAWSLMDNFEWSRGYSERFGLHYVDFNDANRTRIPKASARYYKKLITDNGFIKDATLTPFKENEPYRKLRYEDEFYYGTFPEGFAWSTATASYQIEGGWNEDGKGLGIWDVFSHTGHVDNNDTGDVACDSYHKFHEDIQLLRNIKATHYRFSLSWPRILPDGTLNSTNIPGLHYYNNLIDALLGAEIIPMVTLYHWDLPQALMKNGGWQDEKTADLFADYARLCFKEFGDRVKYWITLNEPFVVSNHGYEIGVMAPGIKGKGDKIYAVGHNLIKAHAKAYRIYEKEFRDDQNGQVGITLNTDWQVPANPHNSEDQAAADRAINFMFGWFLNPVIKGDYPDVMKEQVGRKSEQQGLPYSRLPEFTQAEREYIKGSYDFLGMNFYTSNVVTSVQSTDQSYIGDQDAKFSKDPSWLGSGSTWLKVTPTGIRRMLNWVKYTYGDIPVYITENGVSDRNGSLQDDHRIHYYKHYINNVLKAIRVDGIDVRGYTAWSLMDNFEWSRGYSERFGLHYVDFNDPKRPRTPKASARYFTKLVTENGFLVEKAKPNPKPTTLVRNTADHKHTSAATSITFKLTSKVFLLVLLLLYLNIVDTYE